MEVLLRQPHWGKQMAATKSGDEEEAFCMCEVLTAAKTFLGSGRIENETARVLLQGAKELPPEALGHMIKKYVRGLSDEEAGKRLKKFFAEPPEAVVGTFLKSQIKRRLKTA